MMLLRTVLALFPFVCLGALAAASRTVAPHDWPTLGRDRTRNAVSAEKNPPLDWQIEVRERARVTESARNIKWSAPLGSTTFGTPVVADGLVWVGTNNVRLPQIDDKKVGGALMCFREKDGQLLYEYQSPRMPHRFSDSGWGGIGCSPLVEGDRLWFTTNRAEALCLDIGPLRRGTGLPRELWKLDMVRQLGVFPRATVMGPARTCSIAPSFGDRIFVVTGNGVDLVFEPIPGSDDKKQFRVLEVVHAPKAPSLVCLNKNTGAVLWQDNSPGANLLKTQTASPLVVEIKGRAQVIVPQGDSWLRSFDPVSGKLLWKFDLNPKESVYPLNGHGRGTRNEVLATPVLYENRVYVAVGQGMEEGEGPGRLCCIDPTRTGDISSELAVDAAGNPVVPRRERAMDPARGEKAISNPNSGLLWEYTGRGGAAEKLMSRTLCSVVVDRGLVIVPDVNGMVHCVDARSGKHHWSWDSRSHIWTSPLVVDDWVYILTEDGDTAVLRLSSDPAAALPNGRPRTMIDMRATLLAAPIFANGVLYMPAGERLYAIQDQGLGHWPLWRGPHRDNVCRETGLLKEWPAGGPPLRWRAEGVGEGIASVAVAGGRVYTAGCQDGSEFALALDQQTGKQLWSKRLGPVDVPEHSLMRLLSQRIPTVDEDRVYLFAAAGDLVCLRTADGGELWRKSYPAEFGVERPRWGYCDRPLVDGEKLICAPYAGDATVVALDKRSGKLLWSSSLPDVSQQGYAAVVRSEGVHATPGPGPSPQYVVFTGRGLIGISAQDGRLLWRYDGTSSGTANSHTPVPRGDVLLTSNGYNTGIALLKMLRRGDGIAVQEQYRIPMSLDPFQDATIWAGRRIFAVQSPNLPLCIDAVTGRTLWGPVRTEHRGKVALLWADDHLYLRFSSGAVVLADAGSDGYVERGTFALPGVVQSSGSPAPVIAGGQLFLRDNSRLFCYDLRENTPDPPQKSAPVVSVRLADSKQLNPPLATPAGKNKAPDAVFVPTPQDVVEQMLALARVKKSEVVTDLGSGDGRIVITAARKYGCKAIGYEIDPTLVALSRMNVGREKLDRLVTIEDRDIFTVDLGGVDVVAVFLYPRLLERLLPQFEKLKAGSRIVSHQFAIPGVTPDRVIRVKSEEDGDEHTVYLWTLPLRRELPRR